MIIYISGVAMVKEDSYTTLHTGTKKIKRDELFQVPPLSTMLGKKSSRYGRFDAYTRFGCAAAGLALHDSSLVLDNQRQIGFILASSFGSFVTDQAFYETTAGNGKFASPNLFSYTLPNIVIGECALQYGLTGPTYCVDTEDGCALGALTEAAWCLEENSVQAMLAGWIEVLPTDALAGEEGAIVLILEKNKNHTGFQLELEIDSQTGLHFPGGERVNSIFDLLHAHRLADIVSK